uniref:Uncharacterized protein n=1 Tax=Parascaris equorum TaxID=6256 RepID=A0A914RAP3_PAREQ
MSSANVAEIPTMRFNEEPFDQRYEIGEELGKFVFASVLRILYSV